MMEKRPAEDLFSANAGTYDKDLFNRRRRGCSGLCQVSLGALRQNQQQEAATARK